MLKNIKIGVFISLVNILIQGVTLLFQNIIANNLGIVNFGHFGVLQTDYTIFCAIADFGMMTLILAYFGKRASEGSLFTNVLQLRLFMTLLSGIAMIAFACLFRRNQPTFGGELILVAGLLFQHAFFDWYFICGHFWKKLLISKVLHTLSFTGVMTLCLYVFHFDSIPLIALATVLAALPAFSFGVSQAFSFKIFRIRYQTFKFFKLMLKSACPFAATSIASFAYLPVGLYTVSHVAPPEFLGAYNFSHRLMTLASSLMVYFIYSSVLTLHKSKQGQLSLRDQAIFTAFIIAISSPLWLFPSWTLKIIFFASPWTPDILQISSQCLQILSFSLLFQAIRLGMISTLLKEKKTILYGIMISIGGLLNIAICSIGARYVAPNLIPVLTLSGDFFLTLFLGCYFIKNRRLSW
ncbi:MAG: oligosaccharide flippase family protein [Fibrobacter sp.]|nr:oligosaccharide flippase family protein [Fibrobacter sp.]